jgi:hypothetical protein
MQDPNKNFKLYKGYLVWVGAHPMVLLRLYRALIPSRMEYTDFLFHRLNKTKHKNWTG